MSEPRTPEAERDALEAMVKSDGWRIYMEHVSRAWGPEACETQLRAARENVDPDVLPFEINRILDTFDGLRADLRWPEARVRALRGERPAGKVDPFAWARRIAARRSRA